MLELTDYGWHREDSQLKVTWDSVENVQRIQHSVEYLTQGCKCIIGQAAPLDDADATM